MWTNQWRLRGSKIEAKFETFDPLYKLGEVARNESVFQIQPRTEPLTEGRCAVCEIRAFSDRSATKSTVAKLLTSTSGGVIMIYSYKLV